jgi:hypothetical protein
MQLLYNQRTHQWVHLGQNENLTIGGLKKRLPKESEISSFHLPFHLLEKTQHVGPFIGIMTAPKDGYSLAGNTRLFIQIQKELLARKALSYVFSYQHVIDSDTIEGYTYLPDHNSWLRAYFPIPDLIYNRIPYRRIEETSLFLLCRQQLQDHKIPLFNPGFIDKYQLYQMFNTNQLLKSVMPDTILVESKDTLEAFFTIHKDIYLKPRNLSKGRDILRLNGELTMIAKHHKQPFENFSKFWEYFTHTYPDSAFIAQKTIHPATKDHLRYDFRILAHWSSRDQAYVVTGTGIRASEPESLTTHTINGGIILPYKHFYDPKHDTFFETLVQEIGRVLTDDLGFFGEFSIDAGVDSEGNYVLYEVNSKPMSFDELEIEQKRISHLCDLFLQSTGFQK